MNDKLIYIGVGKYAGKLQDCLHCKKCSSKHKPVLCICSSCPLVQERTRAEYDLIANKKDR